MLRSLLDLASIPPAEQFENLARLRGARVERIVSPPEMAPSELYDQPQAEYVVLLKGGATLWCEGSGNLELRPGDAMLIPAHQKHRVVSTVAGEATIWLAIHEDEAAAQ